MANRKARLDPKVLTISDLRDEATKKLPSAYSQYFNEGAGEMITLLDNEAAYNRYRLRPRILRNVDSPDLSSSLFGQPTAAPIGISPTAAHKAAHPDGEIATARAASENNTPLCLSSWSNTNPEDVLAAAKEKGGGQGFAMQITILRNRSITAEIIKRAEKAGYRAIFVSVDLPILGQRLNESRNDFTFPANLSFPTLPFNAASADPSLGSAGLISTNDLEYDPTPHWDEAIRWLRSLTAMEIWLKGVYTPEDLRLAQDHGLDGVVISNHGGRQLDGVPATLDALRDCADVIAEISGSAGVGEAKGKHGKRLKIAVDGGIRRGSDIFKALALGANFCFVGRPVIWGLVYNGEKGIDLALKILLDELRQTMMLCGCRTIAEISRGHLSVLRSDGVLAKL